MLFFKFYYLKIYVPKHIPPHPISANSKNDGNMSPTNGLSNIINMTIITSAVWIMMNVVWTNTCAKAISRKFIPRVFFKKIINCDIIYIYIKYFLYIYITINDYNLCIYHYNIHYPTVTYSGIFNGEWLWIISINIFLDPHPHGYDI